MHKRIVGMIFILFFIAGSVSVVSSFYTIDTTDQTLQGDNTSINNPTTNVKINQVEETNEKNHMVFGKMTEVSDSSSTGTDGKVIDESGNVHIVWSEEVTYGDRDIFYRKYVNSSNQWERKQVIADSSLYAASATIHVDDSDNLHVFWLDNLDLDNPGDMDFNHKMFNSTFKQWSSTEVLTTVANSDLFLFQYDVKINILNNVHLFWSAGASHGGSGNDEDIFHMKFDASSNTWSSINVVSQGFDSSSYLNKELFFDRDNNLHVFWVDNSNYDGAGTDRDLFHTYYNITSNAWETPNLVTENSTTELSSSDIKIVPGLHTGYNILWKDETDMNSAGNDEDLFYRYYDEYDYEWSSTHLVSKLSNNTHDIDEFDIAIGSRYVHFVWTDWSDYDNDGNVDEHIIHREFSISHDSWYSVTIINEISEIDAYIELLDVKMDSLDNLHILWKDNSEINSAGSDYDIFYRKSEDNAHGWKSSELISTESNYSPNSRIGGRILIDEEHEVHLFWGDETNLNGAGPDVDIFHKEFSNSLNGWSNTSIVTDMSNHDLYSFSDIVMKFDNNDDLYIFYPNEYKEDGITYTDFYIRIFDQSNGQWMESDQISGHPTSLEIYPDIMIDPHNKIHIFLSLRLHNPTGDIYFYSNLYHTTYSDIPGTTILNHRYYDNGIVDLTWNHVEDATAYNIYISDKPIHNTDNLDLVETTSNTYYSVNMSAHEHRIQHLAVAPDNPNGEGEVSNYVTVDLSDFDDDDIVTSILNNTDQISDDNSTIDDSSDTDDSFLPFSVYSMIFGILAIPVIYRKINSKNKL